MSTSSLPLAGKYAIVTGGSRGIGRAIALEMAARGASGITITYASNHPAAESTIAELAKHNCEGLAIHWSPDPDTPWAESVIQKSLTEFNTSQLDILVNNAGDMSLYSMGEINAEKFHKTFNTNVLAPYLLTQAILPVIRKGGSIVNVSSRGARTNVGGITTLYQSSKAALEHLTRQIATTHAKEKLITVNNVVPGGIATEIFDSVPEELMEKELEKATAERRLGRPEEVADVVCFLVGSHGARWINGDSIAVCGGATMW